MKKYIKILEGGTSSNYGRDWMEKPFLETIRGYLFVCATTPFCSVLIRADFFGDTNIEKMYKFLPEKKLERIVPDGINNDQIIPLDTLKKIVAEFPKVDEYTDDTKECEECGGSGSVEWTYKSYEQYYYCPQCDGAGDIPIKPEKTGKQIFDSSKTIMIGDRKSVV